MSVQHSTVRQSASPASGSPGAKVRSLLSATDTDVDGLSKEIFLLQPAGYAGPSRMQTRNTDRHERQRRD
jgi:hypothetical protein